MRRQRRSEATYRIRASTLRAGDGRDPHGGRVRRALARPSPGCEAAAGAGAAPARFRRPRVAPALLPAIVAVGPGRAIVPSREDLDTVGEAEALAGQQPIVPREVRALANTRFFREANERV